MKFGTKDAKGKLGAPKEIEEVKDMFLEKHFEKKMEEFRKRKKRERERERERERNSQMQTCFDTNLERERIW